MISLFSIYVESLREQAVLRHGTGCFFHKVEFEKVHIGSPNGVAIHSEEKHRVFFVTARHLLYGSADSALPDTLRLQLIDDQANTKLLHLQLFSESGVPRWKEIRTTSEVVPIVAISVEIDFNFPLYSMKVSDTPEPANNFGTEAVVVGFPFDQATASRFNIPFPGVMHTTCQCRQISSDSLCLDLNALLDPMLGAPIWRLSVPPNSTQPEAVDLLGVYVGQSSIDCDNDAGCGVSLIRRLIDLPARFEPDAALQESAESKDTALVHFTQGIDAFISILKNGFLYLHNETDVYLDFVGCAFGSTREPKNRRMVCFTDMAANEAGGHVKSFGPYGVAVSKVWAVSKGAARVVYIDKSGPFFAGLKRLVSLHLPSDLPDGRVGDEGFAVLHELHNWMQTDRDVAQREWRIWGPHGYGGMEHLTKQQQIRKIISLINDPSIAHMGTEALALSIPIHAIKYFICPADAQNDLREKLAATPWETVPVIDSPAT